MDLWALWARGSRGVQAPETFLFECWSLWDIRPKLPKGPMGPKHVLSVCPFETMGPRPNKTQILHVSPFVGIGPSGHHEVMWPRPKICFLNGVPLDSAGQSLPWGPMGHRPQNSFFQCGPSGPLGSRPQIWVNKYVLECLTHWAAPLVPRASWGR